MNIRWSIFALVIALVLATQGLSYWLTRSTLLATLDAHEADEVHTVATVVQSLVEDRTESAHLAAHTLSLSESLARALDNPGAAQTQEAFAAMLKPVLTEHHLDILEVTDDQGVVRYSANDATHIGKTVDIWGLAEALRGKGGMVTQVTPIAASVLAIEPIRLGARIVGTMVAGRDLNEGFIRDLSTKVNADLALISHDRVISSSSTAALTAVDKTATRDAFREKIPVYRDDAGGQVKVVYMPLLIVDEGFVMMVRIDGAAEFQALERRFTVFVQLTAVFLLLGTAVAFLLIRAVLKPLRALRARAEQTAIAVTGKAIPVATKDEIGSVVHVLDTLTERLLAQNRDLAQSRVEAEAASEAKSRFLANMSHEIRTPLNGVLGMAELLEATPLSADQRRYCQAITTSGRALHELLSDILDLNKIEAGKIQTESIDFDLAALVTDLTSTFTELAATHSNRIVTEMSVPSPAYMRGDPTRVRQVLSNLLSNAVKFTKAGVITLAMSDIGARPRDARTWLRFSVHDTGIGIAPEKLKLLFKPFTQADSSTTRRFGGSGLGLVISKHLVELMGGSMYAESAAGAGAHFWFDLPFDPAKDAPAPKAASLSPQQFAARVLLAEDNEVNEQVIRAMLAQGGIEVVSVENGELAVAAFRRGKFDVVLLDCQMPVMGGYEAAKLIRSGEPPEHHVPIIALTANVLAEDRERCFAAGMDDYITKPVKRNVLLQTVARWATKLASLPAAPEQVAPGAANRPAENNDAIARLVEMIGIDSVRRVVRLYLDNASAELEALKQAATRDDVKAFGARLHALKSSSKTLGGERVAELAEAGERLARAHDDRAFTLFEPLGAAMDEFCRKLAAQLPQEPGHAAGTSRGLVIGPPPQQSDSSAG